MAVKLTEQDLEGLHSFLRQDVTVLSLITRAQSCLRAEDIDTIAHLIGYTYDELKKVPNLGLVTLNGIEEALATHHLRLGMTLDQIRAWTPRDGGVMKDECGCLYGFSHVAIPSEWADMVSDIQDDIPAHIQRLSRKFNVEAVRAFNAVLDQARGNPDQDIIKTHMKPAEIKDDEKNVNVRVTFPRSFDMYSVDALASFLESQRWHDTVRGMLSEPYRAAVENKIKELQGKLAALEQTTSAAHGHSSTQPAQP